jgi:hypothetical protein
MIQRRQQSGAPVIQRHSPLTMISPIPLDR